MHLPYHMTVGTSLYVNMPVVITIVYSITVVQLSAFEIIIFFLNSQFSFSLQGSYFIIL